MKFIAFDIVETEIHTEEDWLIILIDRAVKKVVYVTTSSFHPIAQVERERTQGKIERTLLEKDSLQLCAFPLPEGVNAQVAKKLFLKELDAEGMDDRKNMDDVSFNAATWDKHVQCVKAITDQVKRII